MSEQESNVVPLRKPVARKIELGRILSAEPASGPELVVEDEATYFGCLPLDDGTGFVHFYPPLAVVPDEPIHAALSRQPWVRVAVLPEALVPPGPVDPPAPVQEADESALPRELLRQMAPLVFQHIAKYGFAPVPYSPATWRGVKP